MTFPHNEFGSLFNLQSHLDRRERSKDVKEPMLRPPLYLLAKTTFQATQQSLLLFALPNQRNRLLYFFNTLTIEEGALKRET